MEPHTAKQEAIDAIERLPDDVALDEIVYRLYVLNQVRQGLQDVEAGRCISTAALLREVEQWSSAIHKRRRPRPSDLTPARLHSGTLS